MSIWHKYASLHRHLNVQYNVLHFYCDFLTKFLFPKNKNSNERLEFLQKVLELSVLFETIFDILSVQYFAFAVFSMT